MRVYRIISVALVALSLAAGVNMAYADGNVTAEVVNAELIVKGDSKDNRIAIHHVGEGAFTIAATDFNTTINGEKEFKAGKIARLSVMLSTGNDELVLESVAQDYYGMSVEDYLYVDMGDGDDDLEIYRFRVGGNVLLSTDESQENGGATYGDEKGGSDDDYVYMEEFFAFSFLAIITGRGKDTILGKSVNDFNVNTALAGAYINTGTHSKAGDQVHLNGLFTWAGIEIETSQGDDQMILESVLVYEGDLVVKSHDGDDTVEIIYYDGWNMDWQLTDYDTSLFVELGDGNNDFNLTGLKIKGNVVVQGGDQTDGVVMKNVAVGKKLVVELFHGDDTLIIDACESNYAYLHGGKHKSGDILLLLDAMINELDKIDWES